MPFTYVGTLWLQLSFFLRAEFSKVFTSLTYLFVFGNSAWHHPVPLAAKYLKNNLFFFSFTENITNRRKKDEQNTIFISISCLNILSLDLEYILKKNRWILPLAVLQRRSLTSVILPACAYSFLSHLLFILFIFCCCFLVSPLDFICWRPSVFCEYVFELNCLNKTHSWRKSADVYYLHFSSSSQNACTVTLNCTDVLWLMLS